MDASVQEFKPEYTNLVRLLSSAVQRFGDRPLFGVRQTDGWQWITYGEFGVLVNRFRAGLASLGVGRGDRVAVISNNRLEWVVGAHAVYSLGACYVPMYEAQLDKEWQFILSDSGSKVCLTATTSIAERIRAMEASLPGLAYVIPFDGPDSDPRSYAGLLLRGDKNPVAPVTPEDTDVACFIYTSGTTGNPKGVELTHFNLASNVSALLTNVEFDGQDRGVAFLPWAHVFGGCVELHSMIGAGASMAICTDALKLGQYLPEVKPTILFAVPRVWNRIYDGVQKQMAAKPAAVQWLFKTAMQAKNKQRKREPIGLVESFALKGAERIIFPKIRDAFGGRLRYACSGAAALSREVAEFMDNIGIGVYEGYGMTEGSGCTTANPRGESRLGSVGKPIPGVRIVIDKSVAGGTAEEGEIVIYGNGVMHGYHNLDDVTRRALTADGGLRTGDLGRIDADGYLYITGRVKELYKLENGKYVAPVPLEEKLLLSRYIAQCLIFGSDRPHNVALIVPDMPELRAWAKTHGIDTDDDTLLRDSRVRKLLEIEVETFSAEFKGFERIRDFVIDTDQATTQNGLLTPTLKLKRAKVVAKYEQVFASLYPASPSESSDRPRSSYIRELRPDTAQQTARSA
ncbi:MAG TPA: long-chain fatty acid--CoA ligase [Polyangiaceae bacterium]|nr:long-chain fatty acid--CoA ligase [Polyangiaceae bacterium]